jgi:hypothetical protein
MVHGWGGVLVKASVQNANQSSGFVAYFNNNIIIRPHKIRSS